MKLLMEYSCNQIYEQNESLLHISSQIKQRIFTQKKSFNIAILHYLQFCTLELLDSYVAGS